MIRSLLMSAILAGLSAMLSSCGRDEHPAVDVELLATDIHISIAQHTLVLPFVALEDYAYRKQSFSLNRKGDSEHALGARNQFLHDSADSKTPLVLDGISLVFHWVDSDVRPQQVCSLLTREWARSLCGNPWAATRQALPYNRFRLVDLRRVHAEDPRGSTNCRDDDGKPRRPLPQKKGEAAMICTAMVGRGDDDEFHTAVIRIDGHLGAVWTVWRQGQNGETAEAMAEREGKAIVAFVQYALGQNENFSTLLADMCRLRRPGSVDRSHGADCGRATLSALSRSQ